MPYPPLVTDAKATAVALAAAAKVVGPGGTAREMPAPFMYAEDMSFYSEARPTAFAMLGIRNDSAGLGLHGLHSAHFTLDEGALPLGAALHTQWALDALAAFADVARADEL